MEWSDEDKCFIGRCPELFAGGIHGSDEAEVYAELCATAEEWVELLAKGEGALPKPPSQKEFSGNLFSESSRPCIVDWPLKRWRLVKV